MGDTSWDSGLSYSSVEEQPSSRRRRGCLQHEEGPWRIGVESLVSDPSYLGLEPKPALCYVILGTLASSV